MDKTLRILILSDRDAGRGPMAREMLRAAAGEAVSVESAGAEAGSLHPAAVQAMREAGIDIADHAPRAVGDAAPAPLDLVITIGEAALRFRRGDAPGAVGALKVGIPAHVRWGVDDPAAATGDAAAVLEAFRAARDEFRRRADALVGDGWLRALARQRSQMERLMDAMDEGVVAHDCERRIYLFNSVAERITGYSRDEVLGRDCRAVFAGEGLCGGRCSFCDGRPDEFETLERRMSFVTREGETRQIAMTLRPILLDESGRAGVIASIRDVTEVNELRWRLRTTRSFHGMIGVSKEMRDVFEPIRQGAASDYPILITGESGTGKELVANAIHNESRRQGGPFVPVNCGALPEHILESELFGHVRGAFTGAIRDKKGRFELADGGTLFLDEIGDLPQTVQVKLLRVLQEKRFEKVGGERTLSVDVRIITATNRDLRRMVREGTFREDLYYRLCVVPIHIPPLRRRREDIPPLVDQVLDAIRRESGKPIRSVSDEAMDRLLAYRWPGNVREMINALQFASVRCDGDTILLAHLPPEVRSDAGEPPADEPGGVPDRHDVIHPPVRLGKLDVRSVERALAEARGNKLKAAGILGVGRATLYRFLAKHTVS